MSATLAALFAPAPAVVRGEPCHIGAAPVRSAGFTLPAAPATTAGRIAYTCGTEVFLRSVAEPLVCFSYREHAAAATAAALHPGGVYCASGDASGKVRIWDTVNEGENVLKLEVPALGGAVADLSWSPDGQRLLAVGAGRDRFGAVFLADSGATVGEISGHSKPLRAGAIRQARPMRLATGGEDCHAAWFEGPPFKFKRSFGEHTRFVNCVRFSPDGALLATVSSDKCAFLYDGKTGEMVRKLSDKPGDAHTLGIYGVAWSPDGAQLLTASADKTCKLWDAASGACLKTFALGSDVEDQQLGCVWTAGELISVSLAGTLTFLDPENPARPRRVVHGHNKFITALALEPAGGAGAAAGAGAGGGGGAQRFLTGSYDGRVLAWDLATGSNTRARGATPTNQINRMCVAGGRLVSGGMDDTVRFADLATLEYGAAAVPLGGPVQDLAASADGSVVAAVTPSSVDVIRGTALAFSHTVDFQVSAVALSPDGATVAVGARDNRVRLFTLAGSALTPGAVLEKHRGPITRLAFSPDGKRLASGDHNREIIVWDVQGARVAVDGWVHHAAGVRDLAWSPDGSHIVSGSLDGALFVWSIAQPTKRIHIKGAHMGGVNVCLWIDNVTVLSAGQDCCAKKWKITHH